MKKLLSLLLAVSMVFGMTAVVTAEPAHFEGSAQGFGSQVKVKVDLEDGKVVALDVDDSGETYSAIGVERANSVEKYIAAVIEAGSAADVDVHTGATFTCTAIKEVVDEALSDKKADADAPLAFKAGEYEASAEGYNGLSTFKVTFSDTALTGIEVVKSTETAHVGDIAFAPMIADMIAANGSGVDAVAGATFSSRALRNAVNDAAKQAECTNLKAFQAATVIHEAQADIELTYDVVIVGAGGAGLAAAAQAAQDGYSVLLLEKAAEMGGNTLVAGGAYQSVMPYLVWDPQDPDATEGVNPIDGKTYAKVKNDAGRIEILKVIQSWSEEPFDGTLDADHPFVAGEISMNAVRGVHAEYLPILQALKAEIKTYLDWAEPKMAEGKLETELTLFSTKNLHIFQTYYGGLRPSADGCQWIYGRQELVSQVIEDGQDIKPWLCAQGSLFDFANQSTLIGCLWQRENGPQGGVVNGETIKDTKWGAYFAVPYNTMIKANPENKLLTRTTAKELIVEEGKVVGVKAEQYDGTKVIAHASKGVLLATGGYGANIKMVQESNIYWKPEYIADNIGTTNRAELTGDGIAMAQAVGADVEGMGWTQMMPLGWVDNGNLSRGAGENVIFINAATGKRYVDESAERDVLSLGGFENGMSKEQAEKMGLKYVPGIYIEVSNPSIKINGTEEIEGRLYFRTVEEIAEMIGCDADTLRKTIEDYDKYAMGLTTEIDVPKLAIQGTIGDVEKDENGHYLPDTYHIGTLRMRPQAPSTHHTMGGVKVDVDRHVLDTEGNIIPGLYAAGEVTGGIHAGNRLGGNAFTEIIVSGRTAIRTIEADNK